MFVLFNLLLLLNHFFFIFSHAWILNTRPVQNEFESFHAKLTDKMKAEKYGEMSKGDEFTFYRGSNFLFWKDLGRDDILTKYGRNDPDLSAASTATRIWLSGDAHVNNMGAFENTAGDKVFDLNDFDESVIGDYQLDLIRMAVSINLQMRVFHFNNPDDRRKAVSAFIESYHQTLDKYASNDKELDFVLTKSNSYGKMEDFLCFVESSCSSSSDNSKNSRKRMLSKWTDEDGKLEKAGKIEQIDPSNDNRKAIIASMEEYGKTLSGGVSFSKPYFKVKDVARRLGAGIGALGFDRYYVLIEGPTNSHSDDIILDFKAQPMKPSGYSYLDPASMKATDNVSKDPGVRITRAYKALGYKVDDYLGYVYIPKISQEYVFTVRERNPFKESFDEWCLDHTEPGGNTCFKGIGGPVHMAEQYGKVLATAHARSDKDHAHGTYIPYNFEKNVQKVRGSQSLKDFIEEVQGVLNPLIEVYSEQVLQDHEQFKQTCAA